MLKTTGGAALSLTVGSGIATAHEGHGSETTETGNSGEVIYTEGDTPSRDGDWNQIKHGRVYIYYADGYREDAEQMEEYISFAEQHVHDLININPDHEVEWYVYPKETYPHSQWQQVTYTSSGDGEWHEMQVRSLAPSDHDGLEPDEIDEWYKHGVTHEYFQVPMFRVLVNNRGVGNFQDATPRWFVEGVPNYAAVYGTPDSQNGYERRINELIKKVREGNGRLDDLQDENTYTVGTVLVKFMVDEWSWDKVLNVFATPADTWGETLQNQIGVTRTEFERRWLQYANEEFNASYDIAAITPTTTETNNEGGEVRPGTPEPVTGDTDPETGPTRVQIIVGGLSTAAALVSFAAGYATRGIIGEDDEPGGDTGESGEEGDTDSGGEDGA